MTSPSYTTCVTVDQTPEEAFAAITDVRGWWSGEIEGRTDTLGAEFTYRYRDAHYTKQRIIEFVPGKSVVWRVLDASLSFSADPAEWTGTEIVFEVTPKERRTEVRFAHVGLVPDFDCYENCSTAWSYYINSSLQRLITTGQGTPNVAESRVAG